jgi:hypothetical protein
MAGWRSNRFFGGTVDYLVRDLQRDDTHSAVRRYGFSCRAGSEGLYSCQGLTCERTPFGIPTSRQIFGVIRQHRSALFSSIVEANSYDQTFMTPFGNGISVDQLIA